jgi:F0F1-type ATP synthase epsilon subunit
MEEFDLKIISPYKETFFNSIQSCSIEADNDFFEILPQHTNLCSSIKIGKIQIFKNNEELIYSFYSGSMYFDNEKNSLTLFCIDFEHNKDLTLSLSNISNSLKIDSLSEFHLKFTEENNIVLEKNF